MCKKVIDLCGGMGQVDAMGELFITDCWIEF
jgi:hypothetical protein